MMTRLPLWHCIKLMHTLPSSRYILLLLDFMFIRTKWTLISLILYSYLTFLQFYAHICHLLYLLTVYILYFHKVINHQPYNQKADVFSFAIVLWELVTAKACPAVTTSLILNFPFFLKQSFERYIKVVQVNITSIYVRFFCMAGSVWYHDSVTSCTGCETGLNICIAGPWFYY